MWTSGIVEGQIAADASAGLGHSLVGMEINFLVFDRPPEPLDEDVVALCSLAILPNLAADDRADMPPRDARQNATMQISN